MKLNKNRNKTELQTIREACKDAGFDYDKTKLKAVYDMNGNILKIDTDHKELQNILKDNGFTE